MIWQARHPCDLDIANQAARVTVPQNICRVPREKNAKTMQNSKDIDDAREAFLCLPGGNDILD